VVVEKTSWCDDSRDAVILGLILTTTLLASGESPQTISPPEESGGLQKTKQSG
jgi:hypothetical protein